ncbi:RidA family protein [Blastococcus sp. TF02A_35]|uniref:RidA family protein n=1 Tax=Blastococcus sp. TF02A-35 TaxID=2559612 RepID=UPI0010742EFA|nr:RidA family protein [Blastococcus sp. TF02A_35]TFV52395.1 RidA family protein [Blastococcus sp. TF02A_35]
MPVELLNPEGLPKPDVYAQVSVSTGTRIVHLAGQVARTADGEPVGAGDLAAQVAQAYLNVATALAAAGATFDDVAALTVYVVDWSPEKLQDLGAGVVSVADRLGGSPVRPVTLVGVSALGEPDLLVEVQAVAVLP